MEVGSPVIAALDTDDLQVIMRWSSELAPAVGRMKIGLRAYVAHGPDAVAAARRRDGDGPPPGIFLDLKLHDIPTTVAGAAAAADGLGVDMLTVHAAGGPRMVAAAVAAAPRVDVLAVTILTSLDDAMLATVGQPSVADQVLRLGRLAVDAGAAGLVCASSDVERLRSELGDGPLLVVPGIRAAGPLQKQSPMPATPPARRVGKTMSSIPGQNNAGPQGRHDQARVGTPRAAMAAGADWLVVGRAITTASDPLAAAQAITDSALAGRRDRTSPGVRKA